VPRVQGTGLPRRGPTCAGCRRPSLPPLKDIEDLQYIFLVPGADLLRSAAGRAGSAAQAGPPLSRGRVGPAPAGPARVLGWARVRALGVRGRVLAVSFGIQLAVAPVSVPSGMYVSSKGLSQKKKEVPSPPRCPPGPGFRSAKRGRAAYHAQSRNWPFLPVAPATAHQPAPGDTQGKHVSRQLAGAVVLVWGGWSCTTAPPLTGRGRSCASSIRVAKKNARCPGLPALRRKAWPGWRSYAPCSCSREAGPGRAERRCVLAFRRELIGVQTTECNDLRGNAQSQSDRGWWLVFGMWYDHLLAPRRSTGGGGRGAGGPPAPAPSPVPVPVLGGGGWGCGLGFGFGFGGPKPETG
jgi:hypothetical protein